MNPLLSIIIPHYDIPDLLMRCLKSIPVSEDIQVIVVDDNSPNADKYLERYPELSRPNLELICEPKNGGPGYARNVGLDHAKGKWLLFADADDLFEDDMYDILKPYITSEADIIFFKNKTVYSDDISKPISRVGYINKYIDDFIKTGYDKYIRLRYCAAWGKMIKRDYIVRHKIRFDEIENSEDLYFSFCAGYYAKKIKAVNQILYIYTFRKDSLAGIFCSKPGELEVRAEVSFRMEKLFKQLNVNIEQQRPFKWYLYRMLHQDRDLFRYYFFRLPEIYPSIPAAIQSLCSSKGMKFTIKLYLYSFWLWMRK